MIDPTYSTSSPAGPPTAVPTAPASGPASPGPTASSDLLTGILHGVDTETWSPATAAEAQAAIASVAAFCQNVCPARLACPEDACRLYRLEGRSMEALGLRYSPATERVGVLGQPVTGL